MGHLRGGWAHDRRRIRSYWSRRRLAVIRIQAKRWGRVVGRPEVQTFVGALAGKKTKKGIFITTSGFTKEAIEYASNLDTKVVLMDGVELTKLMVDYGVGVADHFNYNEEN